MFGFLHPAPGSRPYRRCYARLCQFQHLHYGFWSLPFHSYEATFLFAAAVDAGAVPLGGIPDRTCCKFMTRRSLRTGPDAEAGRFCASFALLLTAIKLQDDIRDSGGIPARLARRVLRRRLDEAQRYFRRFDSRFVQNVETLIRDHHELEVRGGPVELHEYTVPTANAFGYLFGLMSNLRGMGSHREALTRIGREVGAALILFDCAVDFRRDRRRGEFNPLPDERAIEDAYRRSAVHLAEAAALAGGAFGADALTVRILDRVRERISSRRGCCRPAVPVSPWRVVRDQIKRSSKLFALALSPVLASKSSRDDGGFDLSPEEPGSSPPLDELTEEEKKRRDEEERKRRRCGDSDCCDTCCCCGDSCECLAGGGEALGCCKGAECCAVCG